MAGSLRDLYRLWVHHEAASPVTMFVDWDWLQDVRLVVKVEAALRQAGDRQHEIPQKRPHSRRGPLPGAEGMSNKGMVDGASGEQPTTATSIGRPSTPMETYLRLMFLSSVTGWASSRCVGRCRIRSPGDSSAGSASIGRCRIRPR